MHKKHVHMENTKQKLHIIKPRILVNSSNFFFWTTTKKIKKNKKIKNYDFFVPSLSHFLSSIYQGRSQLLALTPLSTF